MVRTRLAHRSNCDLGVLGEQEFVRGAFPVDVVPAIQFTEIRDPLLAF
jgi:hypothetical protein